jgi:glyoxylase-like metal-dependent hydrolase (beta-lactamase superfamily II)
VAVTAGSNVTGFMPDLPRIARLAHENGALILVDAAQALARLPIDVKPFDHPEHLDFVAGAGHKAYAPFGAGFLYGPRAVMNEARPYVPGGGTAAQVTARSVEYLPSPDRHQGGTPNIAGVVGMARALQFLQSIGLDEVRAHEVKLMQRLLTGMKAMEGVTVYGPGDAQKRLGVAAFNVDGVSDLLTAAVLSEEGAIAVRNGRFCAHIYVDRLLAAEKEKSGKAASGAVRCSVGLYNDETDVDRLLEFVARVRDHQWKGNYKVKGDTVSAEFAGRCADRWMEASHHEAEPHAPMENPQLGYDFEILNGTEACRTYLIADPQTREAALVDPIRAHVDAYVTLLMERRYKLLYTIETHTHADHLSGSVRLKDLTGARMLMHSSSPAPCVDRPLSDGETISLGQVKIEVISTPGHTHDAVCLVLPGRVLTGDTLLIGGVGRTDLPTGNSLALFESLQKLVGALPDDTLVLPAHDYDGRMASTIGREKKQNPRLQAKTAKEFSDAMAAGQVGMPPPANLREALNTNLKCL